MATEAQSRYIADLAVMKTKEFKEVKEMLVSSGIVSSDAETVKNAESLADVTNALTDLQASKFIDVLVAAQTPKRSPVYAQKRIERIISIVDDVKTTVDDWTF